MAGNSNNQQNTNEFSQLIRHWGTTAQRPTADLVLYQSYLNVDTPGWEYYNGSGWTAVTAGGVTTASLPLAITGSNIALSATVTNPGGTIVKQTATPGTQQSSANINIDGKVIAGNADIASILTTDQINVTTQITTSGPIIGTSAPDIGTTNNAFKLGNTYLANGKDIFPDNDIYGMWDRFVNWGITPDEHWGQNADDIVWTGYAAYTNFVTPASITTTNSSYRVAHNSSTQHAFRYRTAATGANIALRCRTNITFQNTAGIMLDDGVNNADGNGANNFYRVYITQSALAGAVTAVEQYRTGGGAVTTNTGPTLPYGQFTGLKILASGTRWSSWTAQPSTFGEGGFAVQFTGGTGAMSWTPARVGIYAKFSASDFGRQAIWDWYDEASS
jgi:hypothetical protein